MKKQLLTVGTNSRTQKHFIMGDNGQLEGTPYFDNYRDCMIAILKMKGSFTSIYDLSERQYQELFGGAS